MRWTFVFCFGVGCAPEPESAPEEVTCGYDFEGRVDAATGRADLDAFLEDAPTVFGETNRIEYELRNECAAIAEALGTLRKMPDANTACHAAIDEVEVVVASNPEVTFDCGDDGVSFTWSGVAEDPALVEALARSMTDHLSRVIELASEAEEQEEVAEDAQDRIATADVDGVSAANFQCLVDALDVYERAIMDCRAFNQMARDLQDAVPCGIAASCPYDLSAPLDVDTGDPTLDEVLEMAPLVDAEVERIGGEMRAACASIVLGLGGDDAGLDATGACELAVSLVDDVVRANPGVYFGYSMKPESRLYWSGSPSTAARLDGLVAVLSEHLDEVLRAGRDAMAEESYANDVSSRDSAVDDPALLECEGEARALYAGAAQECSDLAFAADAFLPTLGIG